MTGCDQAGKIAGRGYPVISTLSDRQRLRELPRSDGNEIGSVARRSRTERASRVDLDRARGAFLLQDGFADHTTRGRSGCC
jgi:hypothetical protein